jgi:glycosyltransferase involved in cell wall biosynthesis
VIPVYNGERFLAEAIESALSQTYPAIELIVVDDGSTDGTPVVIERFGTSVQSLQQENTGVSNARNAGIAIARGDLIALLDADDIWLPDKIDRQVGALRAHPQAGLVFCGYTVVDEDLRPRFRVPAPRARRRIERALALDAWGIGFACTAMVPKAVIEQIGGFSSDLSTSADLEFSVRVASRYLVVALREPLALYRTHSGQMHVDTDLFERDMTLLYESLSERDDRLWRAIQRRAWANLSTRLVYSRLRERKLGSTLRHAAIAGQLRPDRLVVAPVSALIRRARYALLARLPHS